MVIFTAGRFWCHAFMHQRINHVMAYINPWWRHQMETFSALLAICAGNSPVHGEFPAQRPVTRNFDVYFDMHPNNRLSKQSWGWWFETQSRPLWRHRNALELWTPHLHPTSIIAFCPCIMNHVDTTRKLRCVAIYIYLSMQKQFGKVFNRCFSFSSDVPKRPVH